MTLREPVLVATLVTHLTVFGLGVGGLARWVPLPRGHRTGTGLVLMALAMAVLMLPVAPGVALGASVSLVHVVLFAIALWLLIGPERRS